MNAKAIHAVFPILAVLLIFPSIIFAQDLQPLQLPAPQITGGKPLMQALSERKTTRTFSSEKIAPQVLSNLLWAAFGINRPATGHRTAPSGLNSQDIEIYVAAPEALYLWDAKANQLKPIISQDVRGLTGSQDYLKEAAINLVYVSDLAKTKSNNAEGRALIIGAHTGFISQNVYLFCASEGLATVVRASIDKAALAKAMNLRPDQAITLAQSVGYPAIK
jgi:nitroreductase